MSIFETFYLLFKVDSTQLKREVDEVNKKTGTLNKTFKDTEDQTTKTDNEFAKLAGTLGKVAGAYFSVGAVVGGFKNAIDKASDFAKLNRDTGVNIESLQAWRNVVKLAGGDAEAFSNQIFELANSTNSTPDVILSALPAFADSLKRFKTIEAAQAFARNSQFASLGPELVSNLYHSGGGAALLAEVERQIKLGVTTSADLENIKAFNVELAKLSIAFERLARTLSLGILPTLTAHLEAFNKGELLDYIFRESDEQKADRLHAEELEDKIWENIFGSASPAKKNLSKTPSKSLGEIWDSLFVRAGIDTVPNGLNPNWFEKNGEWKDLWSKHQNIPESPQAFYVPPVFSPVSNSQATTLAMNGDIHINTTAQDAKGIASSIVSEIGTKGNSMLAQLQQSNAYFDNGVVV